MEQLVRDFFAIFNPDRTLWPGREINKDTQQSARGVFKIDELIAHAGYGLFN